MSSAETSTNSAVGDDAGIDDDPSVFETRTYAGDHENKRMFATAEVATEYAASIVAKHTERPMELHWEEPMVGRHELVAPDGQVYARVDEWHLFGADELDLERDVDAESAPEE